MGRRIAATMAAAGLAVALLALPPRGTRVLARQPYTVVENRSVVLAPGLEVELGTPVDGLRDDFSLEAYDKRAGRGLAQWRTASGNPILLLASGGVVRAISVAFEPGFRTKAGIELGDPEGALRRIYGSQLRRDRSMGYVLGDREASATYFDTSCTARVNQIGLALGTEGQRALGSLWQPADASDPCAPVD
jgi:hypothetical protein